MHINSIIFCIHMLLYTLCVCRSMQTSSHRMTYSIYSYMNSDSSYVNRVLYSGVLQYYEYTLVKSHPHLHIHSQFKNKTSPLSTINGSLFPATHREIDLRLISHQKSHFVEDILLAPGTQNSTSWSRYLVDSIQIIPSQQQWLRNNPKHREKLSHKNWHSWCRTWWIKWYVFHTWRFPLFSFKLITLFIIIIIIIVVLYSCFSAEY